MANKIVIGDVGNPIAVFTEREMLSLSYENAVSISGEELYIDTFTSTVNYEALGGNEVLKTSQGDIFKTVDGYIFCCRYRGDLRSIPYGTPVRYYVEYEAGGHVYESIVGLYYLDKVERIGKNKYTLNCVSAIGLLDKQIHAGGIYTGQLFSDVVADIVGDDSLYTIDSDVESIRVFGYLPYATRRQNLYQLVFALGVSILKDSDEKMCFWTLSNDWAWEIDDSQVFENGTVTYEDPASRIEVIEHGYYYNKSVLEEVLFDNLGGDYITNGLIIFNKPIYADSIHVEEGNITIHSKGVNYCYATGVGVIKGVPYVHTEQRLSIDNPGATKEKVIRVEDATLVTASSAENVLNRLSEYYFNAKRFKNDIVNPRLGCGTFCNVTDAYGDVRDAFIAKMSSRASSFIRSTCEFVSDYTPVSIGNAFEHITPVIFATTVQQTWRVPDSVFEKDVPLIRVVLIGKGYKGENGETGRNGGLARQGGNGQGGNGGKGGAGGSGGKILTQTINCADIRTFTYYQNADGDIFFSGGEYNLSSANGVSSATGFFEQINGVTYAEPGDTGVDGAMGGNSGYYIPNQANVHSQDGYGVDDTYYLPGHWDGGRGAENDYYTPSEIGTGNLYLYVGGGGGGGAAVGLRGSNGHGKITPTPAGLENVGWGGNGAYAAPPAPTRNVPGSGGNGGHGGGGGGAAGLYVYVVNGAIRDYGGGRGGEGGGGSVGSDGADGCILVYY